MLRLASAYVQHHVVVAVREAFFEMVVVTAGVRVGIVAAAVAAGVLFRVGLGSLPAAMEKPEEQLHRLASVVVAVVSVVVAVVSQVWARCSNGWPM